MLVLPPHAKYGEHGDDPLPLYVVLVSEVNPPPGEKPIEWLLLTNEPVRTFDDAWRVTTWYERRWVIEEYHKALRPAAESRTFNSRRCSDCNRRSPCSRRWRSRC